MKVFLRILLGLGLTGILAAGGLVAWAWTEDRPPEGSQTARFRIAAGEPLATTAQRLAEARLVRNPLVFRWLYQVWQGDGAFPSGTFEVPGNQSARDLAAWFRHAKPLEVRVTIPEGWTATKIARLLEEKQVVSARAFLTVVTHPVLIGSLGQGLSSLEGRLFPDTYLFPVDTPAEEVAKTLVQTFTAKTSPWTDQWSSEELARRIVLASIVEREYRDPSEASVIASVFANRLEKGIPLASCATIEYILTELLGRPHPKRIFFVHTQIPSPYNTYLNKGLPPGPIANPGLTALKAAFEPAQTNYLYFVVSDPIRGSHTFSSNYSQHEQAREAYLNTFVTKG
ncbi:MAG TPA: endolytic transglycosylase MltG [Spirochaetia bacterium]|nr:endolytic transglycosylase MltG [Spirochaetia bacterium]